MEEIAASKVSTEDVGQRGLVFELDYTQYNSAAIRANLEPYTELEVKQK